MPYLLPIQPSLALLFEALEAQLHIELQPESLTLILQGAANDQVSEKDYLLTNPSAKVQVIGKVDKYEPETFWLSVAPLKARSRQALAALIEHYDFVFGLGADFRSATEREAMFRSGLASLQNS